MTDSTLCTTNYSFNTIGSGLVQLWIPGLSYTHYWCIFSRKNLSFVIATILEVHIGEDRNLWINFSILQKSHILDSHWFPSVHSFLNPFLPRSDLPATIKILNYTPKMVESNDKKVWIFWGQGSGYEFLSLCILCANVLDLFWLASGNIIKIRFHVRFVFIKYWNISVSSKYCIATNIWLFDIVTLNNTKLLVV